MQISIKYITPVTYVTHSMGYSVAPEQSHSMIPSTEIYYGQSSLAEANRPNHIVQLLWMAQTMANHSGIRIHIRKNILNGQPFGHVNFLSGNFNVFSVESINVL